MGTGGGGAATAVRSGYRLVRSPVPAPSVPVLDAGQQAVVDAVAAEGHGPLLLLAGPGTGKTTTIVEAVAARVEAGTDPDRILTLTFSRRAARGLRDRIAARLGRTVAAQSAWTFHAFAYALVGERQQRGPGHPVRLLSGPEQQVMVRDLLAGDLAEGFVRWPDDLSAALPTLGFADELRALLARARALGMEPADLHVAADSARQHPASSAPAASPADWHAAAEFLAEYLDVLDHRGVLDYPELVHRAVLEAESDEGRARLRSAYDLVVVDEYQDTDPAQERLLVALAGDGRDLVVVGDPDQAIYGFRGAEVRGLLEFPQRFPRRDGRPARVLTLSVSRRSGAGLLAASRAVARRIPQSGLPAEQLQAHRALVPAADGSPSGSAVSDGSPSGSAVSDGSPSGSAVSDGQPAVEVQLFASAESQYAAVADALRREHLERGTPWSAMAVIVRSAARSVPALRRALVTAGVPVEVAGDELPLAREPAVAPLLAALRAALTLGRDDDGWDVAATRALLLSPLVGADVGALRALGRALRAADGAAGAAGAAGADGSPRRLPRPSEVLVHAALLAELADPADPADPTAADRAPTCADVPPELAAPVLRLAALLRAARAELDAGGSPHAALWALWDGTDWPARLVATSRRGGTAGRAADRDLDAVVALFALAARAADRGERTGVAAFLDGLLAQQVPADTLAERAVRGEAVRALTAHRSKGLEWDVVAVVDVAEDGWPDVRPRGSLLGVDLLDLGGPRPSRPPSALLAEERRLFYVAVTRARRRLLVTAVDSPEDDGERPSRFLDELGVPPVVEAAEPGPHGARPRPLTLAALVADLRAAAVDPEASPVLRQAAVERLAALSTAEHHGRPLVPAARPDRWWGVREPTDPGRPLYPDHVPVRLSGSGVDRLQQCPLRWFLDHEVRAETARSAALGFGSVVHGLAHDVARGGSPADLDHLVGLLDTVWQQLAFDARWLSERERGAAREALGRFLAWHGDDRGRRLVGTEVDFAVTFAVGGRPVVVRGRFDRVEVDDDGLVHVVDLKTGRTQPSARELARHAQLGLYQRAVAEGALDHLGLAATPGGAELVQLRRGADGPTVQAQPAPAPDDPWLDDLLADVVVRFATETFDAVPNEHCGSCTFQAVCPVQDRGRQVVD